MTSKVFTAGVVIDSPWLNDVNTATYGTTSAIVLREDLAASSGSSLAGYLPSGVGAVATTVQSKLQESVSVLDFIPTNLHAGIQDGTYLSSVHTYIQGAVNYAAAIGKSIFFPAGTYYVSASITFPNHSFAVAGEGPTATSIVQLGVSTTLKLFDLSGINGPGVLIENITFNGPAVGYGGIGCYMDVVNGTQFNNCWFRSMTAGIQKGASAGDSQVLNCTFEFNVTAILFAGANECIFSNNTFYRNGTDISLSGACASFVCTGSNHIGTNTNVIYLDGVTDAQFYNISLGAEAGNTWTPVIINMVNSSQRNLFDGVSATDFGAGLVLMTGAANCQNNNFTNIRFFLTGAAVPVGTGGYGVQLGASCINNSFSNYHFSGLGYGVVDSAGLNYYVNGKIFNCTTAGVLLQNADNCEFDILQMSNTTDWVTSGTVNTVWLSQCTSTLTGLTPTRFGQRWSGVFGRTFYSGAIPTTLAYLQGDRIVNVSPAVGSPKAWTCTVTGTPGTWVSEGNL